MFPPTHLMLAQNKPCTSAGSAAMECAIVSGSPAWFKSTNIPRHENSEKVERKSVRRTNRARVEEDLGDGEALVAHLQELLFFDGRTLSFLVHR